MESSFKSESSCWPFQNVWSILTSHQGLESHQRLQTHLPQKSTRQNFSVSLSPEWRSPWQQILTPFSIHLSTILHVVIILILTFASNSVNAQVSRERLAERVKSTRYGKVRGVQMDFPNTPLRSVEAYLGLHYADLDNGGMRFMPPKNPRSQWDDVRAAFDVKPACPQKVPHEREYNNKLPSNIAAHLRNITPFVIAQKEECLSLNLYVPIQSEYSRLSSF